MHNSNWTEILTLIAAAATALGTAVTSIGVFLAWWQIKAAKKLSRTQFEDSLAREYREVLQQIPIEAILGERLEPDKQNETLRAFYRYIDLTNDQIFLRQQGRVSVETWENWLDGIKTLMSMPAFSEAWKYIKERPTTKFDELRHLERSGFQSDPYKSKKESGMKSLNVSPNKTLKPLL
jgi:hypothetical protein